MKIKISLFLAFLLTFGPRCGAAVLAVTSVTAGSITIENWRYGGAQAKVRVYPSEHFDQSGDIIVADQRGTGAAIKETDSAPGATTTSVPSSSPNPIALGVNDPRKNFNVTSSPFSATCDGLTNDTVAIKEAVTAAAAVGGSIYLPPSANGCKVGTLTIRVPVVSDGGSFVLTTGQTTTFTKAIIAPPVQVFRNAFSGQGAVSFAGNTSLLGIYPQWWGALGDWNGSTGTDNLAAINAAINAAAGRVVSLPSGSYQISASITGGANGTKITGAGRESTIIVNAGRGHAITTPANIRGYTVENLGITGNASSLAAVKISANFGGIRLVNLLIHPAARAKGIDASAGDGIDLNMESVRVNGGSIGFDLASVGIGINTINGIACYSADATAAGFVTGNSAGTTLIGCAADNGVIGYSMGGTLTAIGCTAENNSTSGFAVVGTGNVTLLDCHTFSQVIPFNVNNASADVSLINPRSASTPSGASLSISSAAHVTLIGGASLDLGLSSSATAFLKTSFGSLRTSGLRPQASPSTPSTATTLTIANLLIGIIIATPPAAGATVAYTLPTGTDMSAGASFANDASFDWSITNLAAAAAETITITANTGHTIVGNPIIQSANAATGGIGGNSAMFRSRKISATVWVTYRIS